MTKARRFGATTFNPQPRPLDADVLGRSGVRDPAEGCDAPAEGSGTLGPSDYAHAPLGGGLHSLSCDMVPLASRDDDPGLHVVLRALALDRQVLGESLDIQHEDMTALCSLDTGLPGARRVSDEPLVASLECAMGLLRATLTTDITGTRAVGDALTALAQLGGSLRRGRATTAEQGASRQARALHEQLLSLVRRRAAQLWMVLEAVDAHGTAAARAMERGHDDEDARHVVDLLLRRKRRLQRSVERVNAAAGHVGWVLAGLRHCEDGVAR